MKILRFASFESINVIFDPQIHSQSPSRFNKTLISEEFIADVKEYLYDLSDECYVYIELKNFPISIKRGDTTNFVRFSYFKSSTLQTDLMIINVKSPNEYSNKTIADRNYINKELLKESLLQLQSWIKDYDLELLISNLNLPFEKIEDLFKTRESNFLTDVTIVVFYPGSRQRD
jgi:hypothetical protein